MESDSLIPEVMELESMIPLVMESESQIPLIMESAHICIWFLWSCSESLLPLVMEPESMIPLTMKIQNLWLLWSCTVLWLSDYPGCGSWIHDSSDYWIRICDSSDHRFESLIPLIIESVSFNPLIMESVSLIFLASTFPAWGCGDLCQLCSPWVYICSLL
jgi:hypothetical protein